MKIRIKGNSVRYRLTKSEIAKLWSIGLLEERVEFLNKSLVYAIAITKEGNLSANFINNKILVRMPRVMIDELNNTDTVGFSDSMGPVFILVEKDFVCIDNTTEDQSDNYPNPSLTC